MAISNLEEFLIEFGEISSGSDMDEINTKGRDALNRLVKNPDFLTDILSHMALNKDPEPFIPPDINGICILRDKEHRFSLYLYIWEPYTPYPIHDHGSWGIVECLAGRIKETRWEQASSIDENTVMLKKISEGILEKGKSTFVNPIDAGIHSMQPLDNKVALSIHAYGRPAKRGYIQLYHPFLPYDGTFQVYKGFPIHTYRRLIALNALASINPKAAEDTLKRAPL